MKLLKTQHDRDNDEANRQREHDAKQKDEDRKGIIRREVYASAVEEAYALLGYIGGLPDRPLNAGNDGDGLQSFLKANAKIWLVADAEAAHLSQDLAGDFSELFFHQALASHPIRKLKESVRRREEAIAKSEDRRLDSQLADARARNAGLEEQKKLIALKKETDEHVKALELAQQQDRDAIASLYKEVLTAFLDRQGPVQHTLTKLISALREELNLLRDDDKFMERDKDTEQRMRAMLKAHGIDLPGPMPEIVEPV
ncbi:hypothetical protein D5041_10575 [Verminephrobacter aporrectodeae subsp. tuberculatae]|nr:hypothetical protein [Verminephrobacter aporrectodeae subsp. tuberculatae]MCW5289484.1 hypothetical protein [Verminephrobacter aporrectodeae subsp. tuberculatae]